jgi:hypothetical protein
LAIFSIACVAQEVWQKTDSDAPAKLSVTARAANQRILETVTTELAEDGSTRSRTNSIVELATGLHYVEDDGKWAESVEKFELVPGAARAWKAQHRVTLAHNPNTPGAVQHRLPDGRLLSSHVHGVGWYDTATGESVLLAEVTDSKGLLVEDNVDNQLFVRTLLGLAEGLGLVTVAECVETAPEAALLTRRGVRFLQGWHFGKPEIDRPWLAAPATSPLQVPPPVAVAGQSPASRLTVLKGGLAGG